MVNLVDTHCHVYLKHFDNDLEEVIQSARRQGISKILMPNVDADTVDRLHQVADKYPDVCIPMMGLHPCDVEEDWETELDGLLALFQQRSYIAVGEIGLDLYWDKTSLERQVKALRRQLDFAVEAQLPVVLHTRDATDETLDILSDYKGTALTGVLHCFTGDLQQALRAIDLNMMLGIGGVLTFKNSALVDVVRQVPIDSLIVETDAPYLAPMPYRGKRNEPAYTYHTAVFLAEQLGMGLKELAEVTSANARKLFRF